MGFGAHSQGLLTTRGVSREHTCVGDGSFFAASAAAYFSGPAALKKSALDPAVRAQYRAPVFRALLRSEPRPTASSSSSCLAHRGEQAPSRGSSERRRVLPLSHSAPRALRATS